MPQDDKLEQLYAELHDAMRYDAMSLRALALLLNQNKKNREFMKFASAELGRNARHMARAVDYFKPYFTETKYRHADEYLMLFCYAQLKRELAMECFAANKFDFPLHIIRERVKAAKPKREKKPSLATDMRQAISFCKEYYDRDIVTHAIIECIENALDEHEPKHEAERKPSLAERVAEELANLDCLDVVEAANCARNIACIPEVKCILERKP